MNRSLPVLALALFPTLSCSSGPNATAEATAHFRTKQSTNTTNCLVDWAGIGRDSVPGFPANGAPPSNTGDFVADGEFENEEEDAEDPGGMYEITCTVSGEDTLNIDIRLEGPNDSELAPFPGATTTINLDGTIDASGNGTGNFSMVTNRAPFSSTEACTIRATPSPLEACSDKTCIGGEEPGEFGELFVTIECPAVEEGGKAGSLCEADGTLRVRKCLVE